MVSRLVEVAAFVLGAAAGARAAADVETEDDEDAVGVVFSLLPDSRRTTVGVMSAEDDVEGVEASQGRQHHSKRGGTRHAWRP